MKAHQKWCAFFDNFSAKLAFFINESIFLIFDNFIDGLLQWTGTEKNYY